MFNSKMFKHFICYLITIFVSAGLCQNANVSNDVEMQEAFKFSNIVTSTLEEYIRDALPSTAKAEGGRILENVKEGLRNCESFAQTSRNVEQYKVCSSSLMHDGMAALGALQAKYRPYSSGASRMSLFWY